METAIIVDILRRAGARVIVASVETEHMVGGWVRLFKNPTFWVTQGRDRRPKVDCGQVLSVQPYIHAQPSNQLKPKRRPT